MKKKIFNFLLFIFLYPIISFPQEGKREILFCYTSEPSIYISGIKDTLRMNVFVAITFEKNYSLRVKKTKILRYAIYSNDKKITYCEYIYEDQPNPCGIDYINISEKVNKLAQELNFYYVGEKFIPTYLWLYFLNIKIIPKELFVQ
jgi:hypothetical protein